MSEHLHRRRQGRAVEAVMVPKAMPPPPPPPPERKNYPFSKLKSFGLKLSLKYKQTEEFDGEGEDTTGIKFQIWAEGGYHSHNDCLLLT